MLNGYEKISNSDVDDVLSLSGLDDSDSDDSDSNHIQIHIPADIPVDIPDEIHVNRNYKHMLDRIGFCMPVSYTHLTLPTTPYV